MKKLQGGRDSERDHISLILIDQSKNGSEGSTQIVGLNYLRKRDKIYQQFGSVIDLLSDAIVSHPSISVGLDEICTRTMNLQDQFRELMEINDLVLYGPSAPIHTFDPKTNIFRVSYGGEVALEVTLNRADPNTPISLSSLSHESQFVPESTGDAFHAQAVETQRRLGMKLEAFYYEANTTFSLVEKLLGGGEKPKYIGVRRVRNSLIEHSEKHGVFNFSASDDGPFVRPFSRSKFSAIENDKGLSTNIVEMLEAIALRLNPPQP